MRSSQQRIDCTANSAVSLVTDVADEAAEPCAQQAQLPMLARLGMGIASRHHRRVLGDAPIRLPQPYAASIGRTIEPLDRGVQKLGVSREGDGLGLHGGVHRHPFEVTGAQRAGRMRQTQALGEQQFQLGTEALAPMAQVGALMRERVLEERLAGELLKIQRSHTPSSDKP